MIYSKYLNKIINVFAKFQKYILLGVLFIFLSLGALTIYLNHIGNKSLTRLNAKRKDLSGLLGKWNNIKSQQKSVELSLEKNKNFKLGAYINNLITENNLEAKTSSPNIQPLQKTLYEEVSQILTVNNANTKILVQLLEQIENKELVYIKKLEITPQGKSISFAITLATLQQKVKPNENR